MTPKAESMFEETHVHVGVLSHQLESGPIRKPFAPAKNRCHYVFPGDYCNGSIKSRDAGKAYGHPTTPPTPG